MSSEVAYVVSALLGYAANDLYNLFKDRARKKRLLARKKKANQELSRLNLYPSLESLAPGKYFTEDSPVSSRNLVVSLERKKLLPGRVEQMVEKYSERWKSKGVYESAEIAGVTEISYPRAGERESEALHLVVRPFRYFAFLATNANVKLRNDLDEEDREWLLRSECR
jgi:hypothetical protein